VKLIEFKDLRRLKGIPYSRDHWRRLCNAGEAPSPIKIGRRIGWDDQEIDSWLDAKKQARDTPVS
jgi:predicted DNA-binding transcriptional regulator AlpA